MIYPFFRHMTLYAGENSEYVKEGLLKAIARTLEEVKEQQQELYFSSCYSAYDRIAMSILLAQSFYRSGLIGLSRRRLQSRITEGELQVVLSLLIAGDTVERLLDAPLIVKELLQHKEEYHADTTTPTLPALSSRERITRFRAIQRRSGQCRSSSRGA